MKTNTLIIAALALTFGFSSCQNKVSEAETDQSTKDGTAMEMGSMPMNSAMQSGMEKMMTEMHQMEMTGNVDKDFAMLMISHHQAAVDMAQLELESGKDDDLKKMAQNIISTQKKEINELQSFLDKHKNPERNYDPATKDQGFSKAMDQSMIIMMDVPEIEDNSSSDKQFAQMMIPHHEGAVQMAEGFIQFGKDHQLISMAKKMIEDQKIEIGMLKKWQDLQLTKDNR